MSKLAALAALLLIVAALPGCGESTAAGPATKIELTAEQAAAIAAADAQVQDEEQGQKLTKPVKGSAKKK